ncbi:MAG TPA: hypothetical protein VJS40_03590 [Aestuariivirgaceae bacterium]|nr:hypothetical protein [Aestuariivirgaceae bacterium]
MTRYAHRARTTSATIALLACGCIVLSDTRAETTAGSGNATDKEDRWIVWPAAAEPGSTEAQAAADESETVPPVEETAVFNAAPPPPVEETVVDEIAKPPARIASTDYTKDDLFRSDPMYGSDYDYQEQVQIYGGKRAVEPPRPPIELGRQQYTSGAYDESSTLLGRKNPLLPGLAIYGDWRTAVAYNQNNGSEIAQVATRLNVDVDFKITATERMHAFFTPLQRNNEFTRFEFAGDDADDEFSGEFDPEPQTLFFEGDLGAIYSGVSDRDVGFDLPFVVGLYPLFLQNGIWANDAILGGALTIPARNSAALNLANFDITFFAGFDDVDNAGIIGDDDDDANVYGVTAFIDAFKGYVEAGYGLLQGHDDQDGLLTHFVTGAYTRRYLNTISNSTRVFANFGDDPVGDSDGLAIISENSLITGLPSTLLPYANFFIGFGNPQPLVDGFNAGILKNVGINFETDALTGYPKLDDSGSNAWGGAIGVQYLFDLDQQLVFEVAMVQPFKDDGIGAEDGQYGFGVRYQLPLDRAWLFRADATYQILEEEEDNFGIRGEIRRKF